VTENLEKVLISLVSSQSCARFEQNYKKTINFAAYKINIANYTADNTGATSRKICAIQQIRNEYICKKNTAHSGRGCKPADCCLRPAIKYRAASNGTRIIAEAAKPGCVTATSDQQHQKTEAQRERSGFMVHGNLLAVVKLDITARRFIHAL